MIFRCYSDAIQMRFAGDSLESRLDSRNVVYYRVHQFDTFLMLSSSNCIFSCFMDCRCALELTGDNDVVPVAYASEPFDEQPGKHSGQTNSSAWRLSKNSFYSCKSLGNPLAEV